MWSVDVESLKSPVVELPPDLKLQGTQGVGNTLETIADRVGIVVERVDAPLVTNMRVRMEFNSVYNWISHCRICMLAVNLCSQ